MVVVRVFISVVKEDEELDKDVSVNEVGSREEADGVTTNVVELLKDGVESVLS